MPSLGRSPSRKAEITSSPTPSLGGKEKGPRVRNVDRLGRSRTPVEGGKWGEGRSGHLWDGQTGLDEMLGHV
jgi:hypothetical protein